ncbi:hypothetical protein TNIN_141111 [Trichonephila inaurata madagascariensis]|uniref:Uncharacterized protein n=1 Tax=Trichonephila inaurata madagascariensis TaxID=2747483 RepID=A0A8X6XF12_9ARAC|nr:hypothetical protein TNIN_141111 [Trichonephila inaurata madagascariensis]
MNVQNSYRLAYGDCIKQPTLRSHLHNNETGRYPLLTTRLLLANGRMQSVTDGVKNVAVKIAEQEKTKGTEML